MVENLKYFSTTKIWANIFFNYSYENLHHIYRASYGMHLKIGKKIFSNYKCGILLVIIINHGWSHICSKNKEIILKHGPKMVIELVIGFESHGCSYPEN